MIWKALYLIFSDADPEVRRLRKISLFFFSLWIADLILSMYFGSLILSVNATLALNVWVSLVAAALSCQYGYNSAILPASRGMKPLPLPSSDKGATKKDKSLQKNTDACSRFSFGFKRLYVLISFGSTVFVMFGCLTAMGEVLHLFSHSSGMSPIILFGIGVFQFFLYTTYASEIDTYDCISGQGIKHRDAHNITPAQLIRAARQLRNPLKDFLRVLPFRHTIARSAARAVAPLTCIVVSLTTVIWASPLWEMGGTLFLILYVFGLSIMRAKEMLWLLGNNAVREPSVVAACDRAVWNIKLVDGVLQVRSSIFWEVVRGEVMAIVRLQLMSSADPTSVTARARQILEGVASYVFVEACFPHDEDDDDNESNAENGHTCHGHSHSNGHNHSHSHGHGCEHSHHFDGFKESSADDDRNEESSRNNGSGSDSFLPAFGSSSSTSSIYFGAFPQHPLASVAKYSESQSRSRLSCGDGNYSRSTPMQSFTVVPPPFPKPPS